GAVVSGEDSCGGVGEFVHAQAEHPADQDEAERGEPVDARVVLGEHPAEEAERERKAGDDPPVDVAQDDAYWRRARARAELVVESLALSFIEHGCGSPWRT